LNLPTRRRPCCSTSPSPKVDLVELDPHISADLAHSPNTRNAPEREHRSSAPERRGRRAEVVAPDLRICRRPATEQGEQIDRSRRSPWATRCPRMRGHIDMGIARKCRTAMAAGDGQQTLSVTGGHPAGTRHLPAFGDIERQGSRRELWAACSVHGAPALTPVPIAPIPCAWMRDGRWYRSPGMCAAEALSPT
jgi:hypothetical protein